MSLNEIAKKMCAKGKGILAADESTGTIAKRFKSITLDRPRLIKARKNLFYDWLKKKKKLGGQNKVPRLLNERSFIEELIEMN